MIHKTIWGHTFKLWYFGILKVPMIFWLRPKVFALNDLQAKIMIPLKRKSKNHLHSMYFGALCVGADIAAGIHLIHFMKNKLHDISFVFKDFHAEFLKRPESDVTFTSESGEAITQLLQKAAQTKQRENTTIIVLATTTNEETVARFTLTLSLKFKT